MTDTLFPSAGLFFFLLWSVVLGGVSIAAFGRELIPLRARLNQDRTSFRKESFRIDRSRTP